MLFYKTQELRETFMLIRSERKCFETFKILYQILLMMNGDNKSKQIYKII